MDTRQTPLRSGHSFYVFGTGNPEHLSGLELKGVFSSQKSNSCLQLGNSLERGSAGGTGLSIDLLGSVLHTYTLLHTYHITDTLN